MDLGGEEILANSFTRPVVNSLASYLVGFSVFKHCQHSA